MSCLNKQHHCSEYLHFCNYLRSSKKPDTDHSPENPVENIAAKATNILMTVYYI